MENEKPKPLALFNYSYGSEIFVGYLNSDSQMINLSYRLPMAEDDNYSDSVIEIEENGLNITDGKLVAASYSLRVFDRDDKKQLDIYHNGENKTLEEFIDNIRRQTSEHVISLQVIKIA